MNTITFFTKTKQVLKNNWIFYLIGFAAILGLKLFYRNADSCDLMWILTPTARWVGILCGNTFENIPHIGYVNHTLQFIIAGSCSGVQFLIIMLAVLIFSYTHRSSSRKNGFLWVVISFALSYFFTILINGLRIILAIYLPLLLEEWNIRQDLLTQAQLHTLIGTVVYFSSLLVIYNFAGWLSLEIADRRFSLQMPLFGKKRHQTAIHASIDAPILPSAHKPSTKSAFIKPLRRLAPPAFWYFFMVLGIPLLHNGKNGHEQFAEFAVVITVVCAVLLGVFYLIALIRK